MPQGQAWGTARRSDSRSRARFFAVITSPYMLWMRPQLARIAGGWLVFHLCLLISIPTIVCSTMSASTVGAECTCDHGDGQMCPMHHTRSSSKVTAGSHSCSCRSTSDPLTALVASLTGPAAVLAPSVSVIASTNLTAWTLSFNPAPLDASSVPDSPPPRE